MTELRNCSTCAHWRPGTSPAMDMAARDQSFEEVGACEAVPPQVFIINDGPVTLQPTTHMTRCCVDWAPPRWFDDPENPDEPDGDGEPHPKPILDSGPSRIRHLFPIKPAPIAA